MNSKFMNSENSKTSDPHSLLINSFRLKKLKKSDKTRGKVLKSHAKAIDLKKLTPSRNDKLELQIVFRIRYSRFENFNSHKYT